VTRGSYPIRGLATGYTVINF